MSDIDRIFENHQKRVDQMYARCEYEFEKMRKESESEFRKRMIYIGVMTVIALMVLVAVCLVVK